VSIKPHQATLTTLGATKIEPNAYYVPSALLKTCTHTNTLCNVHLLSRHHHHRRLSLRSKQRL